MECIASQSIRSFLNMCPHKKVAVEKLISSFLTTTQLLIAFPARLKHHGDISKEDLCMMGQQCRSESLFYYFRIEDHVPENHLLRAIDRYVSLDFIREKLKSFYSETGRPSIDPERLLRILLIGYLYGVTSERKLIDELRMHLAWRWFTGLTFDQEVPHHSTFSKNRYGRFQESDIFQDLFEQIVQRCVESGLVQGDHLSVDGSFIQADASNGSRIPREQLSEVAQVKRNVREYLEDLERENPSEGRVHQQDKVSATDPDAVCFSKGERAPTLGYFDNYLIDNASCIVLAVEATEARSSQEIVAARNMLTALPNRLGSHPKTLAADTGYGKAEFLSWLETQGITSYIPLRKHYASSDRLYSLDHFIYHPESNSYECPEGRELKYIGIKPAVNRSHIYRSTEAKCRGCSRKAECTTGRCKQLVIHVEEPVRERARQRAKEPDFFRYQRERRKVEALFGELKNQIGLRRVRLRRLKHVREQFLMAATAQNLKRLVRYLATLPPSEPSSPIFKMRGRPSKNYKPVLTRVELVRVSTFSTATFLCGHIFRKDRIDWEAIHSMGVGHLSY
jgi:transposase